MSGVIQIAHCSLLIAHCSFCRKNSPGRFRRHLVHIACSLLLLPRLGLNSFALEWKTGPGYRDAELTVPARGKTGFAQLSPAQTGLLFTNSLNPVISANNQILENGAGVALGDVDGDGWCDIFLCGSERPSALYRNLGGWKFEEITVSAGIRGLSQFSTGAAFADVDGDGDLDLLINGIGVGTRLFLNDGHAHFTEDLQSGLARTWGATSLAVADLDGDGDLDLYVCNYRTSTIRDEPIPPRLKARLVKGKLVVSPEERFTGFLRLDGGVEVIEKGEPDLLYLNDGHGKFSPVSWTGGAFLDESGRPLAAPPEEWGLSVMLRDLNGDGVPDIYVCNDFLHSRDRLWLNDGRGKFRAAPPLAWRNMPASSMAIDGADINRDGYDDFLVVEMLSRDHRLRQRQRANAPKPAWNWPIRDPGYQPEFSRNTLQLARGDGSFAEVAQLAGLAATEWSWGVVFLDVDLDGWEDVLIATGSNHDQTDSDMLEPSPGPAAAQVRGKGLRDYGKLELPNLAFRNRRDLTFEESGAAWGFNALGISQGMALADLDNDGDLDVVINNLNREAWLYRNESVAPRLAVRLRGRPPNTRGIGARLQVSGGPVTQTQTILGGGRYLSSDEPLRVFAAGSVTNDLTIEVTWRRGQRSIVSGARANHLYEIDETGSRQEGKNIGQLSVPNQEVAPGLRPLVIPLPAFTNVSSLLNHTHVDEPFDDFAQQPLLPNRLSQLGPGVSWFDLDGDGWDDVIVASGKGGQLAAFHNDGHGGFQRMSGAPFDQAVARDQTTVLGWTPRPGQTVLLAGSASYEDAANVGAVVRLYDFPGRSGGSVRDALPGEDFSAGPLAMADVDGDGDLDLFVGGRVVPGRYPEAARSRLFLNDQGEFKRDEAGSRPFESCGLVSGAVFSDLDGDGQPDLILACEWGPLRVFLNQEGRFTEATKRLGLEEFKGFWNGVATGDFDGDGRLDLVASNWGRNTRFQASRERPWRLYYGDFAGNSTLDLVEAGFDPALDKIVPWRARDALEKAMPGIRAKFPTFRAYANAGVEEVIGDRFRDARQLEVNTLDSMVFLNRVSRFEARPLPAPAQFAPAFGIGVGDLDGDGHEDLFLAQNFFGTEIETSRCDAGRGLWLRGDGQGNFQAVPGQESGLAIYGEQRGVALADYDQDGRVDLLVGQNHGATQLFHNRGAKPGLRVRLQGRPGNAAAVGATLRLKFGERMGPAREVQGGSGYWSQDSFVPVLARPEEPSQIWVRWPGGRTTTSPLSPGAKEVAVSPSGAVQNLRSP